MYRDENRATIAAPTPPTVKQALMPSAAETAIPEAAITEVRSTPDRLDFLLILLRSLSAWGT